MARSKEPIREHKEQDDDLRTAITKNELLEGLNAYIDKMFAVKTISLNLQKKYRDDRSKYKGV